MGAQRAGLQKDDVVVAMDGKPTTNYPELTNALQGRHAGDVVKVEFYRGSEKMAADMALSQRPMPEVPPTPQALAEAVKALNARAMTKLAACFEGVTTAQASHRPAPGEWSALDVLAHFVAAERETQTWITDLLNDDERWSDRAENPTNVTARIDAITWVYPTTEAMLELLRRSQAETVAMLADLPPAFVARKGSYWRLGRDLLTELSEHVHEHAAQIRAAVAVAG
jgi:membrane-associated protease RseP (regulator of RpoE activity)